jgi:CRISPR-associated protein Cas1
LKKGNLDVLDGAFVVVIKTGVRRISQLVACMLMLEPVHLFMQRSPLFACRCLLVWVGDGGVRLMLRANQEAHVPTDFFIRRNWRPMMMTRLKVVRKMYGQFGVSGTAQPERRSMRSSRH